MSISVRVDQVFWCTVRQILAMFEWLDFFQRKGHDVYPRKISSKQAADGRRILGRCRSPYVSTTIQRPLFISYGLLRRESAIFGCGHYARLLLVNTKIRSKGCHHSDLG